MTNPRHKLTDEQKIKVVQRLAAYDPPAVILKWLREEYALTVDRTAVTYYDPNSYAGRRCPERWKTLFFAMRKATVANWAEIGAANKMVRVRWLDGLVHDAMDRGDAKLAAQILAQVAREMDPRYATKKQEYGTPPARDIGGADSTGALRPQPQRSGSSLARSPTLEGLPAETARGLALPLIRR